MNTMNTMNTLENKTKFDNVYNIPQEMQDKNHWVLVQLKRDKTGQIVLDKNGKGQKLPIQINNKLAKVNDGDTWNTFDNILNKYKYDDTLDGVGYVLSTNDNYIIVDIDNIDMNREEKLKFINKYPTYTELSQSSKGYHLIFKIDDKKDFLEFAREKNLLNYGTKCKRYENAISDSKPTLSVKQNDFEVYLEKRYFWLTGEIIDNKFTITKITWKELIDIFLFIDSLKKSKNNKITNKNLETSEKVKLTDDQVLQLCKKASNSDKFTKLWNYDINFELEEYKDDTSAGDIALANILTFYTQDIEQVKRLLRKSNRNRDKFDREDYLERTIYNSLNNLETTYNPKFNRETDIIDINENHIATYHYFDSKGVIRLNIDSLVQHLIQDIDHCMINTPAGFYVYANGYYKHMNKNNIKLIIENHVHVNFKHEKIIGEVYNRLLRREQSFENLNKKKDIIVFNNCCIQYDKNGNFTTIEHSPDYLTTFKIHHDMDNNIHCALWEKTLNELLPQDQIKLLQEIFGYLLIADNSAKQFFVFLGTGDTGKSLVTKVIYRLLGADNISALSLQNICNPHSNFTTANLHGKLANIHGDVASTALNDSSTLKLLTGDDLIHAERKYLGSFSFYNLARLIFAMNELPNSYNDRTDAFYRRWIIIPFENVIPLKSQNKKLHDEINIQGVINWALIGLQRLLKNKMSFSISPTNENIKDQYKKDNSNVFQFTSDCIAIDQTNCITIKELYNNYKLYCIENSYSASGKNKFISEMKNCGYNYSTNCKIENKKVRGFINIKFVEDMI